MSVCVSSLSLCNVCNEYVVSIDNTVCLCVFVCGGRVCCVCAVFVRNVCSVCVCVVCVCLGVFGFVGVL